MSPGGVSRWGIEAAVRTFNRDLLADRDAASQLVGVVTKRFDGEADLAVALVGAGNGERVGPFKAVKREKGKLAGLVPPLFAKLANHFKSILTQFAYRQYGAVMAAGLADAAAQGNECTVGAQY